MPGGEDDLLEVFSSQIPVSQCRYSRDRRLNSAGLKGDMRQASLRPLATIMPAAPSSQPGLSSSARKRARSQ